MTDPTTPEALCQIIATMRCQLEANPHLTPETIAETLAPWQARLTALEGYPDLEDTTLSQDQLTATTQTNIGGDIQGLVFSGECNGPVAVEGGKAVLLSTPVGVGLKALMEHVGLVGQVKGKLRLLTAAARAGKLARVVERVAAGGAVPLVDVLHTTCLLWERDRQEVLATLIAARDRKLWPLAQAIGAFLGCDSVEHTGLISLLGTKGDLERRTQR